MNPGPRPLPANVHILRGNPSKKNYADLLGEFQPEVELPDFPSWIWPEAKKEWKRIGPLLVKDGLVAKHDRAALTLYCQAWAKWVWHERMLNREMAKAEADRELAEKNGEAYEGGDGIMVKTANGNFTYSHHWVAGRRAESSVKQYLEFFGLSASSRGGVKVSNNRQATLFEEASQDAWSAL